MTKVVLEKYAEVLARSETITNRITRKNVSYVSGYNKVCVRELVSILCNMQCKVNYFNAE